TLWTPLQPAPADTLSVWVVARLLDTSGPPVAYEPLPTFAVDSALRRLRFAPVGARAPVDTVQLTLRRP
ncbi:MAG TPA: hypothetical protein VNA89_12310, partial [Gemmatimonadaceae bacterium]|nr:hypothetical protein [Gemmatimonadaceae bacterium]